MLYIYDDAIVENLKASLTEEANQNVFLTTEENYQGILAQIQDDTITYPLVLLHREPEIQIDTKLQNFTRYKFGVPCVFDNKKNNVYYERAIPVVLTYTLRVLSTNVFDADEIARELFFKYLSMYFLMTRLPYESDRQVRFGVAVDRDYGIKNDSGSFEYISTGKLYQTTMQLKTEGTVSITYTPRHVNRTVIDTTQVGIEDPTGDQQ